MATPSRPRNPFRVRVDPAASIQRLIDSLPAIVQITVSALIAYSAAHFLLGHEVPFLAVTVCITSLGFARDARPKRVFESASGIFLGVLLSNVWLLIAGRGMWQLVVVFVGVMALARLLHPSPSFAVSAGVQAVLVQLIPVVSGEEYARVIDAVIGGVVAVAATALVPRNAKKLTKDDSREMFVTLERAVGELEKALRLGESERGVTALEELRASQSILDRWQVSLDSAREIARVSPFLRGQRQVVARQEKAMRSIDHAARNLRVVARRVVSLTQDARPRFELAEIFAMLVSGVQELNMAIDDPAMRQRAQQTFLLTAITLDPARLPAGASIGDTMVVMQARPLLVDLLVATGMPYEEARRALPNVAV